MKNIFLLIALVTTFIVYTPIWIVYATVAAINRLFVWAIDCLMGLANE